ncbi:hypothetical protein T05_7207 [Trichinella murrelli]|uniref:BTB domain-containing protein n=1 Tax=Trichinella murrelli TaxID=144512 RepID=A0A0V0TDN0_9BILA|nr:hypothetical protein T05_7207 [Trichinella murrelli]
MPTERRKNGRHRAEKLLKLFHFTGQWTSHSSMSASGVPFVDKLKLLAPHSRFFRQILDFPTSCPDVDIESTYQISTNKKNSHLVANRSDIKIILCFIGNVPNVQRIG